MSVRASRILQIVAVCLFFLTLFTALIAIPFQEQIKGIYYPDLHGIFNIPYTSLLTGIVLSCYGGICLVLQCVVKAPVGTKIVSVLLVVFFAIINIFVLPAVQQFTMQMVASESANAFASYNALENGISLFTTPMRVIATALSLYSLGGFYGSTARIIG